MRVILVQSESKANEVVVRGKTAVFGLLKRNGKVYIQVVKNCSVSELMPIIEELASKASIIYSDGFKSYDGIVDYGYKEHYRVIHKHKFYFYLKECEFRYNVPKNEM